MNLWDIFTAKHEYNDAIADQFGRKTPLAASHFDFQQPVVSQHLCGQGFRPHYPNNRSVAVCLTHDIDVLRHSGTTRLKSLIGLNRALSGASVLHEMKTGQHPSLKLKNLYELERRHNARSTFFMLAAKPGERDFNYPLESLGDELSDLANDGFEIGLHGNFDSAANVTKAADEKQRVEKVLKSGVSGYRNHYLCFDIQRSWQAWQQAGFTHDSTFGFANAPGFRNGMCFPFRPHALVTNECMDIVEFPLVAMDTSLFNYLRLDTDHAFALVTRLFERVRACNGVFTLLWHNHFMHDGYGHLYERLLQHFNDRNAWMATQRDVLAWWKQKGWLDETNKMLESLRHA